MFRYLSLVKQNKKSTHFLSLKNTKMNREKVIYSELKAHPILSEDNGGLSIDFKELGFRLQYLYLYVH